MIKTNIKMRVTPEQSAKVQEICFKNGIKWVSGKWNVQLTDEPFLFIDEYISFMSEDEDEDKDFLEDKLEEIDPELFIRTNGSCVEDNNKAKNPNSKHYELWENFEAIDVIKLVLTDEEYKGFLKGNILKYQLRLGKKDEVSKEIEKIEDYKRELKNEN